jgi:two-component system CheB/CheR fusion protein
MRLDYEEFELKTRLADITKFFQSQIINKDLTLSLIYDESIPQTIIGDFHKIRQILTNLIGNAIKFTETGEIQVIVTKNSGLYREINYEKLTNNQGFADKQYQNRCQLIFEVKDTGIGIRPEDRAQIFKSFFQAESSPSRHYAGTGLGLAICEQLVQLMNGKIGVESEFGKGSKFWFTINLEFLSPDMAAGNLKDLNGLKTNSITDNQQIETEHKSLESLKILVVEDTRINQKVIQQQLKRLGCTADCVNNGQEALFQLDAADYDLILMDCQMPVLDGYAATEMIREREQQAQAAMRSRSGADALSRSGADALSGPTPNLPSLNHGSGGSYPKSRIVVIGLTAYAMKGDREKCLAAGMDDYLSKPVSINDLSAMLRKWTGN